MDVAILWELDHVSRPCVANSTFFRHLIGLYGMPNRSINKMELGDDPKYLLSYINDGAEKVGWRGGQCEPVAIVARR